ncbi:MAG: hypothetical protein KME15_20195 [Drouetiella hepatica Uher 2000/2452]|jgi:hypothetical protein|uniref:Tetrahydromethanopterin S-methyltransferase n=1 Tax=Drouetiella hepatica Uher 2000/2452 TaxID=904376 RepID=A0A951QED3_9CYAN|nr:hypothetical protein [Drouetiella hepatica Uher 2000/2452]
MNPANPTPRLPTQAQQPYPLLKEMQEIRKVMTDLSTEVVGLRKDLRDKKTFGISDQVAKGVMISYLLLGAIVFVLQVISR